MRKIFSKWYVVVSIVVLVALCAFGGIYFSNDGLGVSKKVTQKSDSGKKSWEKLSGPKVVLGLSKITVPNKAVVATQVDRVLRDVNWEDSPFDQRVPLDAKIESIKQVVPYMEGARVIDLMKHAQINVLPLGNAKVMQIEGKYFAQDSEGNYKFLIDPSKLDYPSVIKEDDYAILPDTHGFNSIAGLAGKINPKPNLAIACMDLPSKADAALYLAKKGLDCYAPCDRFGFQLLGYKSSGKVAGTIIGTAPIRKYKEGAVIGNQPLAFSTQESICVQYTGRGYPDQYCDTPWRYFTALKKKYELDLDLIKVSANVGEAGRVVEEARKHKINTIGVRVYDEADAKPVKEWLSENENHKVILFHSAPYEPGYELFFKFSERVTFGDLNPKVILK